MNPTLSSETHEKIPPRLVPTPAPTADGGEGDEAATPGISGGDEDARLALKKRRRGRFWKGLGLVTAVTLGSGGLYLTQTSHGRQIVRDAGELAPVAGKMFEVRQNPHVLFQEANSDIVNILLVGRDADYKQVYKNGVNIAHKVDNESRARSDTMIIMSLDRARKTIRMVSLPRDAMINMPDNPENSGVDKLNAAHSHGGVPLLKQTLHDELGITIHHHAVIKFDGFKKVIDRVGGVYVDVLGALHRDGSVGPLKYEDKWAGWKVDLKPGKQWLNGEQAHGYVRFRMDIVGDPRRIQRQQSVMRALARRLKEIPPWEVPGVVKEIRQQFETDMSDHQLLSAGFFAKDEVGESSKIQPITLYGSYTTKGSVRLNRSRNKALLRAIFGSTFNEENFLANSPGVRGYEFGPDEDKPEVRRLLIEAGLIKPKPGEAARLGVQMPPQQAQIGTSNPPLSFLPGTPPSTSVVEEPRRDIFTAPGVSEASSPSEEPRRRVRVRRVEQAVTSGEAAPVESYQAPAPAPEQPSPEQSSEEIEGQAMPADAQAPMSPNASDSDDLSVESPIPQPEN